MHVAHGWLRPAALHCGHDRVDRDRAFAGVVKRLVLGHAVGNALSVVAVAIVVALVGRGAFPARLDAGLKDAKLCACAAFGTAGGAPGRAPRPAIARRGNHASRVAPLALPADAGAA